MDRFDKTMAKEEELKFVNYLGNYDGEEIYLLKKVDHRNQGVRKVEIHTNFKKPIWTTQKRLQTHKQKREYAPMKDLDLHMVTNSSVAEAVARSAKDVFKHHAYAKLWDVKDSAYFYGGDITHANYIKEWWINNGKETAWNITALDTETNIENPDAEYTTHISIANKTNSFLGVLRERFEGKGYKNDQEIVNDILQNYIDYVPNGKELLNSKYREIKLFDDFKSMVETTFDRIHSWETDILAIWNMDYDIPRLEKQYIEAGGDIALLYKDPSVPDKFAKYEYKKGNVKSITITDDGKEKSHTKDWFEVTNVLRTSAGFITLDAANVFHAIRSQEPLIEGGMSLNNVLEKILDIGKVKDDSVLTGATWHIVTSNKKPAFYSCYSMFDVDAMILLDEKTEDMMSTAPFQLGSSSWENLSSLPKRLHVAFHFSIMKDNYVVGTAPKRIVKDSILGIGGGWIVTVPAFKKLPNRNGMLKEDPKGKNTHFKFVYDFDIISAYPFATVAANVSSMTTECEVVNFGEKLPKSVYLTQIINIVNNKVNAPIFTQKMMNYPTFRSLYNLDIEAEVREYDEFIINEK